MQPTRYVDHVLVQEQYHIRAVLRRSVYCAIEVMLDIQSGVSRVADDPLCLALQILPLAVLELRYSGTNSACLLYTSDAADE